MLARFWRLSFELLADSMRTARMATPLTAPLKMVETICSVLLVARNSRDSGISREIPDRFGLERLDLDTFLWNVSVSSRSCGLTFRGHPWETLNRRTCGRVTLGIRHCSSMHCLFTALYEYNEAEGLSVGDICEGCVGWLKPDYLPSLCITTTGPPPP